MASGGVLRGFGTFCRCDATNSKVIRMANVQAHPAIWMKLLAACGVIVPLLDVLATIGLAATVPNYSHTRQYISELGEPGRPYAIVFNIWCVVYGLLFAGFAVSLGHVLGSRPVFFACLAIAAVSVVGGV